MLPGLFKSFNPLIYTTWNLGTSVRSFSTFSSQNDSLGNTKPTLIQNETHLTLTVPDRTVNTMLLDYVWLRDNCQCEKCFNHQTFQKRFLVTDSILKVKPKLSTISESKVHITWDDGHYSVFTLDWIQNNMLEHYYQMNRTKCKLWDKTLQGFVTVPFCDFRDKDETLHLAMNALVSLGFFLIENVPPTVNDTRQVVERISHIEQTLWGDMWVLETNNDPCDTAFTNSYIPPHVDGNYLSEAFGLQVFHCLHEPMNGGDTILVDGFQVASQLHQKDKDAYFMLSTTPLEWQFRDKQGQNYQHCDTVLKHHPVTQELVQIRFNSLDLMPFKTIPQTSIRNVYKALIKLQEEVNSPNYSIKLSLRPGYVLFVDNWRVMHGREAYEGNRKLCGCYVSRSSWLNRARMFGII